MGGADYWFESHDGLRLFSRVYAGPRADAPVVLCLHGLMRNSRDFEELAPHLAARARVIVPDVRGRGFSARDTDVSHYGIPVYLQDVWTLLNGLGAQQVSVIGTSMGGLMAMVMAVTERARIVRIVLNDVGPHMEIAGIQRIRSYAGKSAPARNWAEAIERVRGIYGAAWPHQSDARWAQLARRSYRANEQGVPVEDADPRVAEPLADLNVAAPDLWPLWAGVVAQRVPALALRGELSDLFSAATVERMRREMPGLRAVTVANRGHVPLLDEPEALAAIDAFLL
jgi:pimeloyl-ACP methyl ester carboxylesterase